MASGALLRGLLLPYDAVAHGPRRYINSQSRVGDAGVLLQAALDQRNLGGRVVDGLRDIDDTLFVSEGLDDFRTVFPILPIASGEEGGLHLPGEHGPAFALVKPVNSGDEVGGPYLKVVVLIRRGDVRGQIPGHVALRVHDASVDAAECDAAGAGVHEEAPIVAPIGPEMDGRYVAGLAGKRPEEIRRAWCKER